MKIVRWTPAEARERMDDAMAVYGEAMGYPPEAGQHRAGFALAHTRRPAFRAVAALGDGDGVGQPDELLGFGYGYAAAPGQWWHDQVRAALPPAVAEAAGCATASSCPSCTSARRTRATAPAGRCCATCSRAWPQPTVLLSTPGGRHPGLAALPVVRLRRPAPAPPLPRRRAAVRGARPVPLPLAGRRPCADRRAGRAWPSLARRDGARPDRVPADAGGDARDRLTVATVLLFAAAVGGARRRSAGAAGRRPALVVVAGGGGLLAEAVGVATGFPFGRYDYAGTLGPTRARRAAGDPAGLGMMAWPAYLVGGPAGRAPAGPGRGRARSALAAWDLFLDPQMVAAGHWRWADPPPALPGVPTVPLTNYPGWLLVALAADGAAATGPSAPAVHDRTPCRTRSTCGRTPPRCWPTPCSSACRRRRCGAGSAWALVAVPLARSLRRPAAR